MRTYLYVGQFDHLELPGAFWGGTDSNGAGYAGGPRHNAGGFLRSGVTRIACELCGRFRFTRLLGVFLYETD